MIEQNENSWLTQELWSFNTSHSIARSSFYKKRNTPTPVVRIEYDQGIQKKALAVEGKSTVLFCSCHASHPEKNYMIYSFYIKRKI